MTSDFPILYSFFRCPYAMRARFALAYSGIQCELREVDLKNKPQQLLDISPKGTVPVLLFPDGKLIEESMDIVNYALEFNDPESWNQYKKDSIQEWVEFNDSQFAPILRKYKYYERYPEEPQSNYRKQAEDVFISKLEDQLAKNPYIAGGTISLADIAIFTFIRQFAMTDQIWFDNSPYTNIKKWLENFLNNPLYEMIMKKHTPWKPGDDVVLFL